MEVDMTETLILIIAFELLMVMGLAVACITIYILGRKTVEKAAEVAVDERAQEERKKQERLQQQFMNMMNYTGRESADED